MKWDIATRSNSIWVVRLAPHRERDNMTKYSYDRRASTRFELVYQSGGTGGPYDSEDKAKAAAERLLKGGSDRWIAVIDAKDTTNLTRAKALWLLKRGDDWEKGPRTLPNVRPMDHFKEAAKPPC
jgi:hypothetical protein